MNAGTGAPRESVYRPDIDGLRAIAIVAVILFHAKVPGFAGGFVGVDVFFVISGYLVTGLLLASASLPAQQMLGHFYLRRARRILPALFVLLAVVAVAAWWLESPTALRNIGSYLWLGTASLGNLAAWQSGGYFGAGPDGAPLLHIWSLGVEEQFYLAYPLLFLALRRSGEATRARCIAILACLSFALCVWGSYHHALANYYLPFTRAWELLLGAMLALRPRPQAIHGVASQLLAAAALVALLVSLTTITGETRYPGLATLIPCSATAVLIGARGAERSFVALLLSWRPLVFIGLISYSLYLWHLPLLLFAGEFAITPLRTGQLLLMFAALLAIATLSWLMIERPIRRARALRSTRGFSSAMGAMAALLMGVGAVFAASDGFPGRFPPAVRLLYEAETRYPPQYARKCLELDNARIAAGELCRFGPDGADSKSAMLWGDSHALALLPALEALAETHRLRLYFAAKPVCRPLSAVAGHLSSGTTNAECAEFNAAMTSAVHRLNVDTVVLAARWNFPDLEVEALPQMEVPPGPSNFQRGLEQTLRDIQGPRRRICAVQDVPRFPYRVAHTLAVATRRGLNLDFMRLSRAAAQEQLADVDRVFASLRESRGLVTAEPAGAICGPKICEPLRNGRPVYSDWDHLTVDGALLVAGEIGACFSDAPVR